MIEPVTGRYTDSDWIQVIFGAKNVQKWLDLDDEGVTDAPSVEDRLQVCIESAEDYLDDRLRNAGAPYTEAHSTITRAASLLAGVYAYEARGVVDWDPVTGKAQHRLMYQKAEAEKLIEQILSGEI